MEVKRHDFFEFGLGRSEYIHASDFDRVTAERDALQLRLNAVEEENDRLRQVLQLARSSHGVFLATDPPRDAWKYNQVSEKIVEALEK